MVKPHIYIVYVSKYQSTSNFNFINVGKYRITGKTLFKERIYFQGIYTNFPKVKYKLLFVLQYI